MNHKPDFDRSPEAYWRRLEYRLYTQRLKTTDGRERVVPVDEFMLMQINDDGRASFKHRVTRNYVFLLPPMADSRGMYPQGVIHWSLYVPQTDKAFMMGTFDEYPVLQDYLAGLTE